MRLIAVSLVALAVLVGILGWSSLTGLPDDQPFQAPPMRQAQPKRQAHPRPEVDQGKPQSQTAPVDMTTLPRRLGPRYGHWRYVLRTPGPHLVGASEVGRTFRYVLQEDTPARFLERGMSGFLYQFRFGQKPRKTVVRLLDGEGRFAWAAGYDGAGNTWVRARPKLSGCGPFQYAKGRTLPPASGVADVPPCRYVTPSVANASTVLR